MILEPKQPVGASQMNGIGKRERAALLDPALAGLEQRREKTRALKQAMMQELLTGRIRLVES